jgi:hypothetical protein
VTGRFANGAALPSNIWTVVNCILCGSGEGTPLSRRASVNSVEMIVIAEGGSHVFRWSVERKSFTGAAVLFPTTDLYLLQLWQDKEKKLGTCRRHSPIWPFSSTLRLKTQNRQVAQISIMANRAHIATRERPPVSSPRQRRLHPFVPHRVITQRGRSNACSDQSDIAGAVRDH